MTSRLQDEAESFCGKGVGGPDGASVFTTARRCRSGFALKAAAAAAAAAAMATTVEFAWFLVPSVVIHVSSLSRFLLSLSPTQTAKLLTPSVWRRHFRS